MRKISGFWICCLLLLTGCDFFKTRYEEIPPVLPKEISTLGDADYSWQVRSLDGTRDSLGHFRGKKLFINLWATWCGPCLAELPKLQVLYDSMKSDTSLVFLFVTDEPDSALSSFLSQNKYKLPFYLSDKKKPEMYDVKAFPTTFIVNVRGEIVYKRSITAKWNHPSVIEFLKKL